MSSKIDISDIIESHFSTLKGNNGEFISEDKKIFFKYPIFIGLLLVVVVGLPNENLIDFFTLSLSVFVGLFLNLLVLIMSLIDNKYGVKDKNNRAELLKQTFYNITYTIIVSLIGLGILFFANVPLFSKELCLCLNFLENDYLELPIEHKFKPIQIIIYFVFYAVFTHTILTLLMVIKRIYKLFKVEIDSANKKEN